MIKTERQKIIIHDQQKEKEGFQENLSQVTYFLVKTKPHFQFGEKKFRTLAEAKGRQNRRG